MSTTTKTADGTPTIEAAADMPDGLLSAGTL